MTTENIIKFPGVTKAPLPASKVLAEAAGHGLTECIVIGWSKDGDMYFSSTTSEGPEVLWLMEQARFALLEMGGPE